MTLKKFFLSTVCMYENLANTNILDLIVISNGCNSYPLRIEILNTGKKEGGKNSADRRKDRPQSYR